MNRAAHLWPCVCLDDGQLLDAQLCAPPGDAHPDVVRLLARPRIRQITPEWYRKRMCIITASGVAALLKLNPYESQRMAIKKKTASLDFIRSHPAVSGEACREREQMSGYGAIACQWGTDHEQEAANVYSWATGIALVPGDIGLLIHEHLPFIGASPDRIAFHEPLLVEIKAPFRREIRPGYIPEYYMPQVQTQMEVCDIDQCHFVQYTPYNVCKRGQLDITLVKRDRNWWNGAQRDLQSIWNDLSSTSSPKREDNGDPERFSFADNITPSDIQSKVEDADAKDTSAATTTLTNIYHLPVGHFDITTNGAVSIRSDLLASLQRRAPGL